MDSREDRREWPPIIAPPTFTALADLASARVGGRAIATNDDFFAPKSNLVKPEAPIFIPGKYTARGKWMDGWESRRRRTPGHDWCVVALGMRGVVRGVNVDTSYFTGNFPSHCSIEALDTAKPVLERHSGATEGAPWMTILPKPRCAATATISSRSTIERPWTHLRLNIFPDGGVARLRVYGDVVDRLDAGRAAAAARSIWRRSSNGGLVLGASDMHFGAKDNLIMPGRAKNMGDGWETRRRRGPGLRLGDRAARRAGRADPQVEIDTNHFKGNYPDSASLEGCLAPGATLDGAGVGARGREILPQTKLRRITGTFSPKELRASRAASRTSGSNIFPTAASAGSRPWKRGRRLDSAPRPEAGASGCCALLRLVALGRSDAGAPPVRQTRRRC